MPLRKPGSIVLLDGLYGKWVIAHAAVGGYWIHANAAHPYHPIVLAYYGFKAQVKPDGSYDYFHAPTGSISSAIDARTGLPRAALAHPTRCPYSRKRATVTYNTDFLQRFGRHAMAECPECKKRVSIEYEKIALKTWSFCDHEPKDYYNDFPAHFDLGTVIDVTRDDAHPGF